KPTSGRIFIMGFDLTNDYTRIKPFIGYLSQNFSHYLDLTVEENLEFFAEIHKVRHYRRRMELLLEFANLKNFRKTLISNLSGGMKQKLALISSLIYDPDILLLDEPTTGVDPVSRREFWFLLNSLVLDGKTIIFTTPYLDEAERFNRVMMLENGNILVCDSPGKIVSDFDFLVLEIICSELNRARDIIQNFGEVQVFGDRLNLIFKGDPTNYQVKIIETLKRNDIEVFNYELVRPTLENVFFYLLKKKQQ
ncbi:MAG: ABC transporter ATP-binding protein, partial [Candidatus Kapaibacteriota bacterium]